MAGGGQRIPHHLVDILEPGYEYNVYEFQHDFLEVYKDVAGRGKYPVRRRRFASRDSRRRPAGAPCRERGQPLPLKCPALPRRAAGAVRARSTDFPRAATYRRFTCE